MIQVDPNRCCYCGGCVSVCPVEALTLAETRLLVSDTCIDCGDCILACPVDALHSEFDPIIPSGKTSKRKYDIVVVGAGPGGSTAAQVAAKAGLTVLLLEKRQEIGSPVRCAEGVGYEELINFIEPDERWIATEVNRAEIAAINQGIKIQQLNASGGRGYILERRIFDRVLAENAALAGAEIRVKTAATGLLRENGAIKGVRIKSSDFFGNHDTMEIEAKVIIAADGVEAQLGRWAGLDLQLPLQDTMVCTQYLLAGIDIDPTCTYYYIDSELAPGGYLWVFPKGEGKANVGLGVQADIWQSRVGGQSNSKISSTKAPGILALLEQFIETNPQLSQGYPVSLISGNVPIGLSPEKLVLDGFMTIGDAARQVDPLTGGGILNAMAAGKVAALTALQAIETGNLSAASLANYQTEWKKLKGRQLSRNYRLRLKFPPRERIHKRFVEAFSLAVKG